MEYFLDRCLLESLANYLRDDPGLDKSFLILFGRFFPSESKPINPLSQQTAGRTSGGGRVFGVEKPPATRKPQLTHQNLEFNTSLNLEEAATNTNRSFPAKKPASLLEAHCVLVEDFVALSSSAFGSLVHEQLQRRASSVGADFAGFEAKKHTDDLRMESVSSATNFTADTLNAHTPNLISPPLKDVNLPLLEPENIPKSQKKQPFPAPKTFSTLPPCEEMSEFFVDFLIQLHTAVVSFPHGVCPVGFITSPAAVGELDENKQHESWFFRLINELLWLERGRLSYYEGFQEGLGVLKGIWKMKEGISSSLGDLYDAEGLCARGAFRSPPFELADELPFTAYEGPPGSGVFQLVEDRRLHVVNNRWKFSNSFLGRSRLCLEATIGFLPFDACVANAPSEDISLEAFPNTIKRNILLNLRAWEASLVTKKCIYTHKRILKLKHTQTSEKPSKTMPESASAEDEGSEFNLPTRQEDGSDGIYLPIQSYYIPEALHTRLSTIPPSTEESKKAPFLEYIENLNVCTEQQHLLSPENSLNIQQKPLLFCVSLALSLDAIFIISLHSSNLANKLSEKFSSQISLLAKHVESSIIIADRNRVGLEDKVHIEGKIPSSRQLFETTSITHMQGKKYRSHLYQYDLDDYLHHPNLHHHAELDANKTAEDAWARSLKSNDEASSVEDQSFDEAAAGSKFTGFTGFTGQDGSFSMTLKKVESSNGIVSFCLHLGFNSFVLKQRRSILSLHSTSSKGRRKAYISLFNLPLRPFFCEQAALPWREHGFSTGKEQQRQRFNGKIKSPHLFIKPIKSKSSKLPWFSSDRKLQLIEGDYDYIHYLQDGCSDEGWGCCYRSLQTVISWFKYQCYTSKAVPTHWTIQKMLKENDLAHKSLEIGDSVWIGVIECQYILNWYISHECKILHLSTFNEIIDVNYQLLDHFSINGSPVMVGVGSLAFTMIGISINEEAPESAYYLLLDPHYTGDEDLNKILSMGWVGWKDVEFMKKTAGGKFINFCCPQICLEDGSEVF